METVTVVVSVPEATLNEHENIVFGQNQIRFPRQILIVESEAETEAMKLLSDPKLRLGILGADVGHDFAFFWKHDPPSA